MSALDPNLSQGTVFPTRGSPLPWLLLLVFVALTVGILVVSRNRLEDERMRTAAALKANDEVHARMKAIEAERDKLKEEVGAAVAATDEVSKRVLSLELQLHANKGEKGAEKPEKPKTKPKK